MMCDVYGVHEIGNMKLLVERANRYVSLMERE